MTLFSHIIPHLGASQCDQANVKTQQAEFDSSLALVFNGWGFQAGAWQALSNELNTRLQVVDQPADSDYNEWFEALYQQLKDQRPRVIAWSLGVQVVARLQQRGVIFESVFAIAGRASFIVEAGRGLKLADLAKFQKRVAKGGARARAYFAALVSHGGPLAHDASAITRYLQPELADYGRSLADLAATVSVTHGASYVLGGLDALVAPLPEIEAEVEVLAEQSHDLPLAAPKQLGELIQQYWLRERQRKVARSFSRAVDSYAESSSLQQRVADSLLAEVTLPEAGLLVDLGSGTGYCAQQLQTRFSGELLCIDLSPEMVAHTRQLGFRSTVGDAQALPLEDNSVDVLVSSLAIQWCPNPAGVFAEIARVLKPNGRAWIATLGELSLAELRTSAEVAGVGNRVNDFPAHTDWLAFARASLLNSQLQRYQAPVEASSFSDLLKHLRGVGANCVLNAPRKPLTRSNLQSWGKAAREAGGGSYRTHYDVVQLTLTKLN
ncbi:methyltransferase domain-containing protein [Umboniibacter marinipuniceus]|uniref:Malonyl-ACP O-methyltransferase BioC n=1 Tax=Umboniibacter marinipuniceus TaxID=569599 RepID=A0A3M0ACR6_9GAMM|nr:methyltransferase domain-containing protein [Umboniibacter marinipuniceus]RMA82336.1 malonyl-ACP O-methyltransferase BioC [Umboniibacter marinipuniceus]